MTDEELEQEYSMIEDHWDALHTPDQYTAANDPENSNRNRYSDVLAMDSSRMKIDAIEPSCEDGAPPSDYINGNLIDGFHKKYICTQGPTEDTAVHFWMMMMSQGVRAIVMLTRTVEGTRRKCFEYFADGQNPEIMLHDYDEQPCMVVKLASESDVTNPTTGKLLAKHRKLQVYTLQDAGSSSVGQHPTYAAFSKDTPFEIDHIQHVSWPDHGTPEDPAEIIHLSQFVNEIYYSEPVTAPLTVHCSAGIGRAGSFISIDACSEALFLDQVSPDSVSPAWAVNTARACRQYIVQTKDQYKYVARSIEHMKSIHSTLP